jgi:cyclophilin family peptidyl-prolyl cis-trans isomerase
MKKIIFLLCLSLPVLAQKPVKKDYLVTMETSKGTMFIILYEDTPKHKENFLNLIKDKFYDGIVFHRVINNFMIQAGDPKTRDPKITQKAVNNTMNQIPYEFTPDHVHIKGALAAARTNNPEKESSPSQFYIVTGKKYSLKELATISQHNGMKYKEEQIKLYEEKGGTPFLDNNYTVFGEVIAGIEVADTIQQLKTKADRPEEDITLKVTAKKVSKKKIAKRYGYTFPF